MTPRRVILLSPFAGDVAGNLRYAKRAMLDAIKRGDAPIASHLLYPQVLDDTIVDQRRTGISCERAWMLQAQAIVAYIDLGISSGMVETINLANLLSIPVEHRRIG